jgi:hypothetical protein
MAEIEDAWVQWAESKRALGRQMATSTSDDCLIMDCTRCGYHANPEVRKVAGGAFRMASEIEHLGAELQATRRERDLAVAHDSQPYPTAAAYEQVCRALRKHTDQTERLRVVISKAFEALDHDEREKAWTILHDAYNAD